MDLVLDTSALLSGRFNSIPRNFDRVLITDLVRDEVGRGNPSRNLRYLLEMGIEVATDYNVEEARKAAIETGDLEGLSLTDLSLIGLAIALKNPVVLTDDFRVQNVLLHLGIDFEPAGEIGNKTIREEWAWTFRCMGCGRYYPESPGSDCPVCGSGLKKTRRKN
jgi:UPF0271 protein